jgi:EmrB/QacA subfamily drug resistance transporter
LTVNPAVAAAGATGYGEGVSRNRAIFTFAIVSLALLMSSIDMTIVSVSLPYILTDLNTNLAWVSWVMTGSQLSQSVMMPIIGKLSDDWGRKRLFLIAVGLFTLSSLAAGFAPSIYFLIIFRLFEGMAGGAFLPSATGIISDAFGKKRTVAIGLFASIFPIGGVIGPNVGGFLIDHISWRWTFFINIPIGILLLILGLLVLPKSSVSQSKRSIDFIGAGLFAGAVLSILYALTNWANNPQGVGWMNWTLLVVGAVFLVLLIRQEDRARNPMIELKLLRWRPFLAANVYNFIYGTVIFGMFAFIPYYATVAYGATAGETGIILTPRSVAAIIMAAITSIFIIRFRYRLPMILGAVLISGGFFLLSRGYHDPTFFGINISNIVLLIIVVTLGGIGMGIANPAANNAVLDLVPEKVAAVTGMRGMFRVSGGIFGTAGVVLTLSFYQDKALGLEHIALFFAILMLFIIPIIFMIPDSARQRRQKNMSALANQKSPPASSL